MFVNPKLKELSTDELQLMYCYYFFKQYNRYPKANEYGHTSTKPKRDVLLSQCNYLSNLTNNGVL